MCRCTNHSLFCTNWIVILFKFWILTSFENLSSRRVSASSEVNSTHVLPSSRNQAVGESNAGRSSGLLQTTSNPKSPNVYTDEVEDFPLWIIVLIVVTGGILVIAFILCMIKLRRWKKDHGTYSMWNNQGPSVEAMIARESGVLFERLDIENTPLAEAQCYEIPVDSFDTPQRIYIDGIRLTPLALSLETHRTSEMTDVSIVDQTQYCPARESGSVSTDVQRESVPSSFGPGASERSSLSPSTVSERTVGSPRQETPKEGYAKPLPVIPVAADPPTVLCETYSLGMENRPLPQTPPPSSLPVNYSAVSLDRRLLKEQKDAKIEKPNTFRTLPRPRKMRQIPLPFLNALARSASSNDVSKEAERLSDHVASDPKKCTLTRMKKRMSQSLDTLFNTPERVSHFYENPYLSESAGANGDKGEAACQNNIPTTSDEGLPKDKEHFYTRISQFIDRNESHLNRHSYASIRNPSFRARPRSKHVYISIIFGSAESVSIPSVDNPKTDQEEPTELSKAMSQSCPNISASTYPEVCDTPRPSSYYPPADTEEGLYAIDTRNARKQVPKVTNNDMASFPDSEYQNIRESLGIPPLAQNSADVYKAPKSLDVRPYYENITSAGDSVRQNNGDIDGHYGTPKSPPIPLDRFCEILKKTNSNVQNTDSKTTSESEGNLEICRRKRDTENAEKCVENGELKTLSTYLEDRFNEDRLHKEQVDETDEKISIENGLSSDQSDRNEPAYENYIRTNRDSLASEDTVSSQGRVSLGSSLSIDDKDEDHPLIPKTSDFNGNSVCDGLVEKLEVRRKSLIGAVFGESVA
ncbi:uncharacterized protein LOC114519478 [Dendronephthya gigantea]|uniref:uncharacterized protein LOC114519478 n=1 Tax=Dendronephthya gigantea TaxID=151771 RepID=UPI00106D2086|nr:uncharacterized protein LOC114519478 [Dendronephthya gigantea]